MHVLPKFIQTLLRISFQVGLTSTNLICSIRKWYFFFLMIFREKKLQNEKIMEIRYIVGTVMFMWMLTFEDLHGHSSTVDVKTKNWNRFQKN